jgi:hypothetical protein
LWRLGVVAVFAPGCASIHDCAVAGLAKKLMVEQHLSTDRPPGPVATYTTTVSCGSNVARAAATVTTIGLPVCGSVEVMAASRPTMAGTPRASIAYVRTPPICTRCAVGIGENR